MAGSLNKVMLIGNLGADPEVKRLSSGDPVVNMRIATTENWRDKASGERRERTEWHNVVVYNEQIARVAEQYLRKGSKVFLEGQLQTRSWEDQSGQKRYTTEIVIQRYRGELHMLDGRAGGGEVEDRGGRGADFGNSGPMERGGMGRGGGQQTGGSASGGFRDEMDDEIPF